MGDFSASKSGERPGRDPASRRGRVTGYVLLACLGAGLAVGGVLRAQAQQNPTAADQAKLLKEAHEQYIKDSSTPDSRGDGPYPATKRQIDGPPDLVAYYPADLNALGDRKMPIYVFGNGACSEDGASSRQHLLEIASHGYLAIAPGGIYSGPGVKITPDGFEKHRDRTRAVQLGEAINWAVAENARAGSPFHGRIDTAHIALSGYSCGGIQALKYAGDSRVTTFVLMNSGFLEKSTPDMGEMAGNKGLLDRITVPIIYVLGGPRDIAYPNGMDDFSRIKNAPAVVINTDVTHRGTYNDPNGGRAAQAVVAWLDWQLRGDQEAAKWFIGRQVPDLHRPRLDHRAA